MEAPEENSSPPLWKRAAKNALFAVVVGAITGVICGFVLPEIGAMMGPDALKFFSAFKPEYMATFLGFSGGVSALLATGVDKMAQPDNEKDAAKEKGRSHELEEDLAPTRDLSHSVAAPLATPPSIDSTGILVTSPHSTHLQLENAPGTAIMDIIHESRLQALPEIAKMRLH